MITPVAFDTIDYHTYTIFAIINAIIVPSVYFFFPETAYRSLEEMDTIFQKVSGFKGAFDVVEQARIEPRRYGKNGELLITIEEADEKATTEHGSSEDGTGRARNTGVLASPDEENQRAQ
jgi:hypothetical protein